MIRVVITGPSSGTGSFPYKIETWAQGKPQFVGVSKVPLLDACRQLKQYGLMDDTVVGLFDEDRYKDEWRLRTTVGYGARHTVDETNRRFSKYVAPKDRGYASAQDTSPRSDYSEEEAMGPYREFPGGPLKDAPDAPMEVVTTPASAVRPAKSAAPPLQPHKLPERPVEHSRDHEALAKSEKSHHRPKPKGSGARRGSRSRG